MAWETRHGRRYFYKKLRVGPRVRSIYVGSEETAGDLIRHLEERRLQEAEKRAAFQRRKLALEAAWHTMTLAIEKIDLLMTAVMLSEGFHQTVNSEWRFRHGKKTAT